MLVLPPSHLGAGVGKDPLHPVLERVPVTDRKPYVARPYQQSIAEHILAHDRCAVWATMGTGKTVATLTAINALLLAGESPPVLVLGPLRVARRVWTEEARKWDHLAGLRVLPIIGSEAERRLALAHDAEVHTCNYENLAWLVEYWGERWPYQIVISDEATRLKNYRGSYVTNKQGTTFLRGGGGMRARALGRVAHTKIKRFIELTGTPSPNGLKDLWGQAWFLDAGLRLGRTYEGFKQRWFQSSHDGFGIDPLPFAQEQIQDKLRDICLTIDLKDYFDLAEPIVNNIYVELPLKARKHYREMEREMFTEIEGNEVEAFGAAARTQKCLQLANGAAYIGDASDPGIRSWRETHSAKLEALESCISEASGAAMLVAYEFKSDAARILKAFPQAVMLATDDGWQKFMGGKAQIGLAHPASMGHGVDGLQQVTNVITFFGHNWNLELYDQMIGRIGPIRQKSAGFERPVFVNHIIATDTVDELVMARRETKREVQDILLEAMKRKGYK